MKRIKNLIAALFISPEIVLVLIVLGCLQYFPENFKLLGKSIRSDTEIWKYLPGLTLIFSTTAFNYSSKLRAPLENFSNKHLYEWPHYDLLVDRVYVSLFYAIAAGCTGLWLWFFGQSLSEQAVGAIFLASTGTSGVTALAMLLAHQKLRELIEKYT